VAYHFDKGVIDGVDVTNRTIAIVAHLPGNILKGNWRIAVYIDDKASDVQMDALLKVYSGKAGGPIADIAKLVGEIVEVKRLPIAFDVDKGRGTIKIGDNQYAELEPYQGATGTNTTLADTIFSTVPGAPVFVGKSPRYISKQPALGIDVDLTGHNALQSTFVFDA
jgi:hypothetical protein